MKQETKCLHAGYTPKNGEPRVVPICQSTTYTYDSTDDIGALFDLTKSGYFYSRIGNPTVCAVEEKIAALEGGVGALCTTSGQAANLLAILNICSAGDSIISVSTIYGGTINLFAVTLKRLGIECIFIDAEASEEEIAATMKWLDYNGYLLTFSDAQIAQNEKNWQIKKQENALVIPKAPFSIWVDSERIEITDGLRAKYANVNIKDFEDYLDLSNVTLKAEEPVCAQELYAVLDKAIQEVINNKDADCKALIERANADFQKNHLDKID